MTKTACSNILKQNSRSDHRQGEIHRIAKLSSDARSREVPIPRRILAKMCQELLSPKEALLLELAVKKRQNKPASTCYASTHAPETMVLLGQRSSGTALLVRLQLLYRRRNRTSPTCDFGFKPIADQDDLVFSVTSQCI